MSTRQYVMMFSKQLNICINSSVFFFWGWGGGGVGGWGGGEVAVIVVRVRYMISALHPKKISQTQNNLSMLTQISKTFMVLNNWS